LVPVHAQGSLPASGSCHKRAWHRFQAFFRWVRPFTPSGLEFVQSSSTHSERVVRMPYPTTLSSRHRFLSLLCPLQLWSPGRLITQEYLPSFLLLPAGISQRASRRTPDVRLSPHPAFRTCACFVFFRPRSDLAHEHGTTRHVWSPTLLENKAILLAAPSDLGDLLRPALSWQSFVVSTPLQDGFWLLCCLRPLSCTLAFSRPFRVKQLQSSPVPRGRVRATRSLPARRRMSRGRTLTDV